MELIKPYQQVFAQYLEHHTFPSDPAGLYRPAGYILSLGGKRLRPVFVLLGCHLYSEDYGKALPAAWAMEVFHNFTLVHDDIMDHADLRRGMDTVHKKYGLNTAILSGDVMLIQAYDKLLEYRYDAFGMEIIRIFTTMAREVCEGQQWDMDFETTFDVSIDDYLRMITLKTSVLLAACIRIGAVIGGADADDQKHLYEFAKNYGVAFQLRDDVLDTFGKAHLVGKTIGGDIIRNKKTYLFLKALELASEAQRQILQDLYAKDTADQTQKVQTVKKIFEELHVCNYADMLIEAYRDLAISHLEACKVSENKKAQLRTLLDQLVFRNS
jgi:geranylgeranyl diphosphate synthase type II